MFSCSEHLKPIAAEERRLEEEEKKAREEQERIAKQLAEGESPVSPLQAVQILQQRIQDL